jgi:hypothetical protein
VALTWPELDLADPTPPHRRRITISPRISHLAMVGR